MHNNVGESMSEFIKGLWRVQKPHAGERGFEVASASGLEQVCQDVTGVNARRIVACVNACDGIPTDHLEAYAEKVGELLRRANMHDELLDALEEIAAWPDGGSKYGQGNIKAFANSTLATYRVRQDRDTHFVEMMRAIEQVDAMKAECENLRKDAERYRYIREGNQWIVAATQTGAQLDGEDLDDLIDSEMEQRK